MVVVGREVGTVVGVGESVQAATTATTAIIRTKGMNANGYLPLGSIKRSYFNFTAPPLECLPETTPTIIRMGGFLGIHN